MENAHLHAQLAAMSEELGQKSEEIRKCHAEQTVVFSRIRELIGYPGEIVNKARLYNQLVEIGDPASASQTIPILVKYSRMIIICLRTFRRWFREAELLAGCFTRGRSDRQLEPSTKK